VSEQVNDQDKVKQVFCRVAPCRYRTDPAGYEQRWAQWSEHYVRTHYDPRWDVPCATGCGFVSSAASPLEHHRVMAVHVAEQHQAVA
jgi:hypothetical protein